MMLKAIAAHSTRLGEKLRHHGLAKREIPHQVWVLMEPVHELIRVSFLQTADAQAFREHFRARLV
ncbi:hypothetical protein [Bosea sp. 124]|uniref:hypothetical protein n=1 Tax=Bosea sp. 124 TaxID=2135642 RepID=UPI000D3A6E9D|nr:hypothetical protein [Bosea sp. 124]PTM40597.1 hypothetical protein C8D03_2126 [Bosea sp. 124]